MSTKCPKQNSALDRGSRVSRYVYNLISHQFSVERKYVRHDQVRKAVAKDECGEILETG